MKKYIITAFLSLGLILSACSNEEESGKETVGPSSNETAQEGQNDVKSANDVKDEEIVATVNGEDVKGADYNSIYSQIEAQYQQIGQDISSEEVAKQIKQQALDAVVGRELLYQDVDKKGFEVSEDDVNKQLDEIKKQLGDEGYQTFLEEGNITEKDLKEQITQQEEINQYIETEIGEIKVTDEEVQEVYDRYVAQVPEGQEKPKLADIKEQLKAQLVQQKQQVELLKIVENLKKDSEIKINI